MVPCKCGFWDGSAQHLCMRQPLDNDNGMVYNRIGGNQTTMKKPQEFDVIQVQRHDKGTPTWHQATVIHQLSAQFSYRTDSGLRDLMLYNSTEWRYPDAGSDT
jgi:hypothetical protein